MFRTRIILCLGQEWNYVQDKNGKSLRLEWNHSRTRMELYLGQEWNNRTGRVYGHDGEKNSRQ